MRNRKLFFQFVIPSVLAFALSGIYTIVDGLFIGNSLGDVGLAAINLGFPISSFIQALGTGIGLAGGIRFTIYNAQGENEKGTEYFSGTILLLLLTSVLLTILISVFAAPVLRLMGAEGEILVFSVEYTKVIAWGAVFQVFATGFVPFIRNMGGATFAMFSMIAGFLTNIALDYLFVWVYNWGMAGAAIATVIGQGVTMVAAIAFLFWKKAKVKMPLFIKLPSIFESLLKMSFAPFGLTFSPIITIIFMNRFLMQYGGGNAVAIYACISYVMAIVYLLLQGVGDGSQPLFSRYYGERATAEMKQVSGLAYKTAAFIAVVCMIALYIARNDIGALFGASKIVTENVASIIPVFLITLLFLSYVRVTTSRLYATDKSTLSYLLVYAEPVSLLILLFILPSIFGLNGVWLTVPLAQLITWGISLVVKYKVTRGVVL